MTNVSKITVNGNDYDIKDTEARSGLSNKQDTLVSGTNIKTVNGNSLLGSGDLTVGGSVDIDGETITENGDNELQVVAVKNKRDDSTLPIWHGTEYQWNHGVPTTWYYWQTNVTAMWTSGTNATTGYIYSIAYGDGVFVCSGDSNYICYSNDDGQSWNNVSLGANHYFGIGYGDGRFIAVRSSGYNQTKYSDDGGQTWTDGGNLPDTNTHYSLVYGDNNFVGVSFSSNSAYYSTDKGINWHSAILPSNENWYSVAYGDGVFVTVARSSDKSAISTDGGQTWTAGGNLPSSAQWDSITYGNNRFIAVSGSKSAISTDGGQTWTAGGNFSMSSPWICFGNNMFVITGSSDEACYSIDGGQTWQTTTMPSWGSWRASAYGNGKFITTYITSTSQPIAIFSVTYDKCYTNTANPTASSIIYSAPEVTSSYTISSITSGAITLSNNNTYYYTQGGNVFTYRTIGDAHPEYLAFIDGVGIKKGNTLIASATPITTSITSTSTDAEAPSAKAVYDEIGEVESALNTINSGS